MRALLLETEERLVMTDITRPDIEHDDQVLVKVRTVGICGSEVHAVEGTHPFRKPPAILGHEMAGDVVAVGAEVTRFQPGDRVVVDPQWPCGQCVHCRAGDINLCPSKRVLGTSSWVGAFGEYIVAPANAVFHLPDNLSYVQGCVIEPLAVAVHVARRAGVAAGESVTILGTGSVGSLVAGVCRAYGARSIIVADVRQHCLDTACERLGATHSLLLPDGGLADSVKALTEGEGTDVAIVTADDVRLVNQALEMVRPRGCIVLVALLTHAPLQFMAFDIIGKELHVLGSSATNHSDVREAIGLAASGQVDVGAIATHVLPVEDATRAVRLTRTKDDGAIKVILTFAPR
jgi:L-iditol 2-dehydrogenase